MKYFCVEVDYRIIVNKSYFFKEADNFGNINIYNYHLMQRSRQRQFDEVRSHAASVRSETNSLRSSKVSQSTVSEACVNCVNQIMADRHRKAQKDQKQKTRAEFRKNYQLLNSWVDEQGNYRESMKKDALDYNSRMIEQQRQAKKHEKQQDVHYAQKVQKIVAEAEQSMKNQFEAQKQMKNQYYQQIHHQYLNQLERKDKSRFNRDKKQDQTQGLPLFNPNISQQKLQYKKQLQRQMEEKKLRENEEKVKNRNKEKEILEESKRQADRYHADNYQAMKMSKEEVFDGLRTLEAQKKKKIEDERKFKEDERMKQIKEENEQRSKAIKIKMKQMQSYVSDLKNQLLEKEQKLRSSKMTDTNFFEKLPKSTQQIHAELEIRKNCKSCHKSYPQQYISPVPKKI